ncbi:ParB/Srx family N-terminal domain-containing protein [Photobacterium minamisatsumaniensis]|uniref:ParB/Srx family N-terminal domain-containing protein n=1 Tax=Photobacterium minamisatsumaniensis TaxID=2910233 RepID=UPI003D126696
MQRWRALLSSSLCLLSSFVISSSFAEKVSYSELDNGDIVTVTLDQLLPTQAILDHDAENANLQNYKIELKNMFDDLCHLNGAKGIKHWDDASSPTQPESYTCTNKHGTDTDALSTVVVAPEDGILYLTTNQTILSTFWDMPNGGISVPITVKVSHNLISSGDDFWPEMINDNEVWLVNEKGKKIKPDDLPEYIGRKQLKHDKYLSLANFLLGISYLEPQPDGKENTELSVPYLALNWALLLRKKMKVSEYDLNDPDEYATAITEAATIIVDTPDDEIVGKSKRTAAEMGKLSTVDSKALETLLTDETSSFGLAIAYRLNKKEKSTPKAILDEEKAKKEQEAHDVAAEESEQNTSEKSTEDGKKEEN